MENATFSQKIIKYARGARSSAEIFLKKWKKFSKKILTKGLF